MENKVHEREVLTGEGGVNCEIKEGESFFKIVKAFVGKIAKKILAGQFNFGTMQRPTMLSNPITHVQIMPNELAIVVEKCKLMISKCDPIDRLKHLVSGVIGNLSYNLYKSEGKGPINPTLGESLIVH